MNFLKKNAKTIVSFIAGAVLIGGISTYAAYNYVASQVGYTKKDGTEIDVSQALNELYASKQTASANGSANNYSTEEQVVGTYPVKLGDGTIVSKNLYQITYIGNTPASSGGTLCTISSLDYFVGVWGVVTYTNGNEICLPDVNSQIYRQKDTENLLFYSANSSYYNRPCSITILYTKTTD